MHNDQATVHHYEKPNKMNRVSTWIQKKPKQVTKVPRMIQAFPMMNNNESNQKAILWDSNGQQLMVDNGASASATPYLTDSIKPPQAINSKRDRRTCTSDLQRNASMENTRQSRLYASIYAPKFLFCCICTFTHPMSSTLSTSCTR